MFPLAERAFMKQKLTDHGSGPRGVLIAIYGTIGMFEIEAG